jgi:hypothetical protein
MTKEDFDEHYDWVVSQVSAVFGVEVKVTHEEAIAPYGEDVDKVILHLTFEQAFAMGMDTYNKLEDVFHARLGGSHLYLFYPCTECEAGIVEGGSAHFADRDSKYADMYYCCVDCQMRNRKKREEEAQRVEELTCGLCGASFKRLRPDGRRPFFAWVSVGLKEEESSEPVFEFSEKTERALLGVSLGWSIKGECFCSKKCALLRIEHHLAAVKKGLGEVTL